MKYFVIVYDGVNVVGCETYEAGDRHAALTRRFELELGHPDSEVVVLGGTSLEHVKQTHGRYFKGVEELAKA